MTIKFFAHKDHLSCFPHPVPASKLFPQFFAKLKPQADQNPKNGTAKRCIPFLEACSAGFIIPMWCDVYVKAQNGTINLEFPDNLPMQSSLGTHFNWQIQDHPLSNKPYGNAPMKWLNPWGIETPKGYSVLCTAPLNHLETRFKILDGVVDTDTYYNQINFPFLWTGGDGEFLIRKGTPLVQVIPFKRERHSHEVVVQDDEKRMRTKNKLGTKIRNGYRSLFWSKAKREEV